MRARGWGLGILKHAAIVACAAAFGTSLMTQSACSFNPKECSGGNECSGRTSIRKCQEGEGSFTWREYECAPEQRCIPALSGHRCDGESEGGACRSDQGCEHELRCENGTCRGPTPAEKARCEAGLRITVPEDGTEVLVDIPLTSHSSTANTITRPNCASDPRGPLGQVVAEGFIHIELTDTFFVTITLDNQRDQFPNGIQFTEVDCQSLYQYQPSDRCHMEDPNGTMRPLSIYATRTDQPLLFYTTAATEKEPVVRVRVKKL